MSENQKSLALAGTLNDVAKNFEVDIESSALQGEALSGHLDGVDGEGRLLFRVEGSADRTPVVIGMPLSDEELMKAAELGRRALVLRTADERPRLVLVGLLRERLSAEVRDAKPGELNAKLDGEEVLLHAKRRIELRCGKARIVLHKSGRIELAGTYLLSKSRGPIKIKGATVEVN